MIKQMIEGCGKIEEGNCGMPCGDSVSTEEHDYETGVELCQPIYCKECWKKFRGERR